MMMMMMGWRWQLDPVDSSSSVQLSSASSTQYNAEHSAQCAAQQQQQQQQRCESEKIGWNVLPPVGRSLPSRSGGAVSTAAQYSLLHCKPLPPPPPRLFRRHASTSLMAVATKLREVARRVRRRRPCFAYSGSERITYGSRSRRWHCTFPLLLYTSAL